MQELQPSEAQADPAEWTEGELQPSSQPADSSGSAPSAPALQNNGNNADSGGGAAAASSSAVGQSEPAEGTESMQVDSAPSRVQKDVLATAGGAAAMWLAVRQLSPASRRKYWACV